MEKLLEGIGRFQRDVVASRRDELRDFAKGQAPRALWITCSDSRVVPSLITQSGGELFVVRNAGNRVPPHGEGISGEVVLRGWVYSIETGELTAYDPKTESFRPLALGEPTES